MAVLDSTEFVAEVRRRAAAPVSSTYAPGWTDADMLMYANGVIPGIQDKLRRVRTNYFTTQKDVAFVSGTASYRIPTRAQHGLIALAQRLGTDGALHKLDKWFERDLAGRNPSDAGTPTNYLWRSNSLVLWPIPDNSSDSLRVTYHRRVSKLVAASVAPAISSVSFISDVTKITLNLAADASTYGITTSTPVDLIRARMPFDSLLEDSTPYAVAGPAVGLQPGAAAVAALKADGAGGLGVPGSLNGLYAGDYICQAGQAPVIQMPEQAFYVVAQAVACMLLQEDKVALPPAQRLLAMLEADLYVGAEDRDDAEADSVANEVFA